MPWSDLDAIRAWREGFHLGPVRDRANVIIGYEIQRVDEMATFPSDDVAVTYVKTRARQNDNPLSLYSRALAYHLGMEDVF